jgi:L-alanine-DL-glutamate epimerase-like enolase superfamily enzyme
MRISLKETRLGLRNSHTRIPFRYGNACLTRCPQAVLQVTIEGHGGRQRGFSGDCLPPGWFDKTSGKDYRGQIDDMLRAIAQAAHVWQQESQKAEPFFNVWLSAYDRVQSLAQQRGTTPLLASFGLSLVERAVMDALARLAGLSLFDAVRNDLYCIRPGRVHASLEGLNVSDWLPRQPRRWVFARHTVGLSDPLTSGDVLESERLEDGFPQTLEQYVRQTGTRYFKIKVSNDLDHDLDRLRTIAAIVQQNRGDDYAVTLDGNEQYKVAGEFDHLVDALRQDPRLAQLWKNTLLIEQPLDRRIALDPQHTAGIQTLSRHKPVIIDESDGTLDAFPRAMQLGYRGVSSKNCKGPIKSLLNMGLVWQANQGAPRAASSVRESGQESVASGAAALPAYLMSAEDLCTVGIVPVQSDLCLVAMLGLEHVERNGHHFHPGLSYLPADQQQAALESHADLYELRHGRVAPKLVDGRLKIASLQCVGFGFAVEPDLDAMQSPDEWTFESLGLGLDDSQ